MATQKLSVQKALRRKFRRYITAKADFAGLVLLKLQVGSCPFLLGVQWLGWGGGCSATGMA